VLDLDGERFAVAPLGSAAAIKVGQAAITIGTPPEGAHAPVVTVGVVSATNQAVNTTGRRLLEMIQTDAAVAPGSAGGAVVDGAGVVIGIATINVEREGNASGYATPIDVARLVAAQLLAHGKVTRGWLGIEGDELSASRAKELGVKSGVVVRALKGSSPAQHSDLRPGDVLVELDGEPIRSMGSLVIELRTRRPGDTVALTYLRDAQQRVAKITLGEKPAN
jgi:S1-C subfamily serine protease